MQLFARFHVGIVRIYQEFSTDQYIEQCSNPIVPSQSMATLSAEPSSIQQPTNFCCAIPDSLLLEALEEFDNSKESINEEKKETKKRQFTKPGAEQDIEGRKRSAIPKKTR